MKILHLIGGGDVGGARVHVLSLVKELGKHIDVKIISLRPGMFSDEAREMGIDIEVVKTGNIVSDIKRVIHVVREGKFEAVHSHGAKANMIAIVVKYFTGIPTVTTVHSDYRLDYLESKAKQYTFGLINSFALRHIDYYTGVSDNFKKMLIERKFSPSKIFTVYNGISFDRKILTYSKEAFIKKYGLSLNQDDIAVGILARLYPVKGIDTFIAAANEVVAKNPSIKFIIGGDGEDRAALEKKVAQLGIGNNVYFAGWVDDPYEFMSNMDINVLTSISESFPYSILEGALLKKATISSDVGGISDLIENNSNGYLFNSGDYKKLAEYIIELSGNTDLRLRFGEKIYEKARKFFSIESMCSRQIEIYEKVLFFESPERRKKHLNRKYYFDAIVSGYYGSGNLGDDAILTALIKDLGLYKENIRLLVISRNAMATKKAFLVDSIERLSLIKFIRALKNSKLFINGGGSLIQDIKSTRSLIYYLGTIWLAKKMHTKVMLYANGIGPVIRGGNRKLTRHVLNKVDYITLRENASTSELEAMNITKPKYQVTSDPAMALELPTDIDVETIFRNEGYTYEGPYACFSIRRWGMHKNYKEVIAKTADYITQNYNLKCVFVPMHHPADAIVAEEVASLMNEKAYVFKNKYTVAQMVAITMKMDMLVGMRLHALIFAAIAGVPFVGLEYENKIEGFLRHVNQFENTMAGHVSELRYDKLKEVVDNVWNNREQIKKELAEITPELKEKALLNAKIAVELIEEDK